MFVLHPINCADFKEIDLHLSIQGTEPYPWWSKDWLHTQGFFSYTSSDSWTAMTEFLLWKKYGIDQRVQCEKEVIKRVIND